MLAERVLAAEQEARAREIQQLRLAKTQQEEQESELKKWGGEPPSAAELYRLTNHEEQEVPHASSLRAMAWVTEERKSQTVPFL